jgi:hypothetical protein
MGGGGEPQTEENPTRTPSLGKLKKQHGPETRGYIKQQQRKQAKA